jgi:hypothetical protein
MTREESAEYRQMRRAEKAEAERDRYIEHSRLLNSMAWDLGVALGHIDPSTERHEGPGVEAYVEEVVERLKPMTTVDEDGAVWRLREGRGVNALGVNLAMLPDSYIEHHTRVFVLTPVEDTP